MYVPSFTIGFSHVLVGNLVFFTYYKYLITILTLQEKMLSYRGNDNFWNINLTNYLSMNYL